MVEKDDKGKEKILEMTIEDLDLSVRSFNCLKRAGINTVEDLINKSEEDMMKVRNLGRNLSRKLYRSSILSVLVFRRKTNNFPKSLTGYSVKFLPTNSTVKE